MAQFLKLQNLASITSGYPFKTAVASTPTGRIKVAQAKDLSNNSLYLDSAELIKIADEIPRSNAFLKKHDVLLVSRGAGNHKVAVYNGSEANLLASASLYIIRLNDKIVFPEYLAVYLRSDLGQSELSKITTGAYIQNIKRDRLLELDIPIPTLAQQKNLVGLQLNIWQQEKIQDRKAQLKKNIVNATISNIVKRG